MKEIKELQKALRGIADIINELVKENTELREENTRLKRWLKLNGEKRSVEGKARSAPNYAGARHYRLLVPTTNEFACGSCLSFSKLLKPFEGKRARVTVEEIKEGNE